MSVVGHQMILDGQPLTSIAITGLIYMRARYYDPQLGRFASEDPSGNGINWFTYSSNNPTNKVDMDGKIDVFSTDAYLVAGVAFLSAALFLMQTAGRLIGYAQGIAQTRVITQAAGYASLAAVSFAKASIGCTIGASLLSAISNSMSWVIPTIFIMTAGAASVGSSTPASIAVSATYAYEVVVVGCIISTEAAEQSGT